MKEIIEQYADVCVGGGDGNIYYNDAWLRIWHI